PTRPWAAAGTATAGTPAPPTSAPRPAAPCTPAARPWPRGAAPTPAAGRPGTGPGAPRVAVGCSRPSFPRRSRALSRGHPGRSTASATSVEKVNTPLLDRDVTSLAGRSAGKGAVLGDGQGPGRRRRPVARRDAGDRPAAGGLRAGVRPLWRPGHRRLPP